jgi:hypothetical protein
MVSFELILLLAVLVLIPLIQLVVRAPRQGDRPLPDLAKGGLPSTNQRPKREPATAGPAVSAAAPTAGPAVRSAMTARTPTARRDDPESAPPPTARLGAHRFMASVAGLDDRNGLRRAIVLTAILGPCRASDPHSRSESGLR